MFASFINSNASFIVNDDINIEAYEPMYICIKFSVFFLSFIVSFFQLGSEFAFWTRTFILLKENAQKSWKRIFIRLFPTNKLTLKIVGFTKSKKA